MLVLNERTLMHEYFKSDKKKREEAKRKKKEEKRMKRLNKSEESPPQDPAGSTEPTQTGPADSGL